MPAVIGTATTSDWSSAGALLTFYFPLGLFIVIAVVLYLQFSRPHTIPGLKPLAASASVPRTAPSGPKTTATGTAGRDDEAINAVSPPAEDDE
jgi:hypothetical protein